jgi:hypothetical protein
VKRALFAALAAVSLFFGASAPAFAAAHVGPSGYVTFWDGCSAGNTVGYCGASWPLNPTVQSRNVCYSVPTGSNDRWSSVDNYTGRNIEIFTAGSCGGSHAYVYAGTMTGQLDSPYNNSVSSYIWR